MLNVLVVGGAGYIGGAVTDLLMKRTEKYNFRVYDKLLYESEYRKEVDFVYGDIRDTERLEPHLRWADIVVWLAALVGDGACAANPDLTVEINEESVEWLVRNFDRRIIFMSTCSVYGANDGILDENSEFNPLSLYAVTKLNAEAALKDAPAIVFRLGTLFGLGDNYSRIRMDLVVNTLTAKAHCNRVIRVFGGDQYRPLLHVKDAAEAIVANLETPHTGPFNLHHSNMKIVDLAERIAEYFPDLQILRTEVKFEDSRNYRVSSDKAIRAFGFQPRRSVNHGIQEIKALLEQGRIREINNGRYSNASVLKSLTHVTSTPHGYEVMKSI